ncbi:hypothetical protein HR12_00780 [Microbacterium sp. SUBG005]|nr:hypothetical protein HR12_00780 [Microbacterium sp. SUBG005]
MQLDHEVVSIGLDDVTASDEEVGHVPTGTLGGHAQLVGVLVRPRPRLEQLLQACRRDPLGRGDEDGGTRGKELQTPEDLTDLVDVADVHDHRDRGGCSAVGVDRLVGQDRQQPEDGVEGLGRNARGEARAQDAERIPALAHHLGDLGPDHGETVEERRVAREHGAVDEGDAQFQQVLGGEQARIVGVQTVGLERAGVTHTGPPSIRHEAPLALAGRDRLGPPPPPGVAVEEAAARHDEEPRAIVDGREPLPRERLAPRRGREEVPYVGR